MNSLLKTLSISHLFRPLSFSRDATAEGIKEVLQGIYATETECRPDAEIAFRNSFIRCFAEFDPSTIHDFFVDEAGQHTDSDLALISLYFSFLWKNNLDDFLPLLGERIRTLSDLILDPPEDAPGEARTQKERQADEKALLIRLDMYLEIYQRADRDNRDFARDFIPLPQSMELLKRFVAFDLNAKRFNIASKLFQLIAEERDLDKILATLAPLQDRYGADLAGRIKVYKLLNTAPHRYLKLADDNRFVSVRADVAGKVLEEIDATDFSALKLNDRIQIVTFLQKEAPDRDLGDKTARLFTKEEREQFARTGQHFDLLLLDQPDFLTRIVDMATAGETPGPGLVTGAYRRLTREGDFGRAAELFRRYRNECPWLIGLHAKTCLASRDFDLFFLHVREEWANSETPQSVDTAYFTRLREVLLNLLDLTFVQQINRINHSVPQPAAPVGCLVSLVSDARSLRNFPLPLLLEGKKRGWEIAHLDTRYLWEQDQEVGSAGEATGENGLQNDWHIDFDRQEAIVDGTNYWQGICEHVRISLRRYHLDFGSRKISDHFLYRLRQMDVALSSITRLFESLDRGRPIKIIANNTHIGPGFLVAKYVEDLPTGWDVNVINFKNGYETLYAKNDQRIASSLSVENLTRLEIPYARMGSPDGYGKWLASRKKDWLKANNKVLKLRQSNKALTGAQQDYLQDLREFREQGGRVYCLLGKVIFDLVEPTKGVAHDSMKDWLNHTITSLAKRSDIRLVIKPHPHELSNAIALFPAEDLSDLIEVPVDHADVLEPGFLSLDSLSPFIDLGIMWSGTSVAELASVGIPTVALSSVADRITPFLYHKPDSREAYVDFLFNFDPQAVDREELKRRGIAYTLYLKSDWVAKHFMFTKRPLTNVNVWPNELIRQDFDQYLRKGDKHVSALFDHML
ncbi:hypothetical protein [Roseibium sp.]|uniref:hypothetical protein n=3 Tax=Roseibium sp. TaxID=1936156 RepID=UPI0032655C0D